MVMIRHKLFILLICFSCCLFANTSLGEPVQDDSKFNPGEMIMHHLLDAHEWHVLDWKGRSVSIPLPIIIFHKGRGLKIFWSSRFNHGKATYLGYKLDHGTIVAVNEDGVLDLKETAKVWDFSITKNVFSLFFSVILLLTIFSRISKRYKNHKNKAPKGIQSLLPMASQWPHMERWWGFRPCTPDQGPILGKSSLEGLWLATGHHRNGVLLAAITSELLTKKILNSPLTTNEEELLLAFQWDRF